MQMDVRSIWGSDPKGKVELCDMVWSDECKELLGIYLGMVAGWIQSSKKNELVLSITCSLA